MQTLSISFNYQAITYLIVSRFQQGPGDAKTGHTEMNLVHHYSTISRVHSSSAGGRGKWIKIANIKTTQHDYHARSSTQILYQMGPSNDNPHFTECQTLHP